MPDRMVQGIARGPARSDPLELAPIEEGLDLQLLGVALHLLLGRSRTADGGGLEDGPEETRSLDELRNSWELAEHQPDGPAQLIAVRQRLIPAEMTARGGRLPPPAGHRFDGLDGHPALGTKAQQ